MRSDLFLIVVFLSGCATRGDSSAFVEEVVRHARSRAVAVGSAAIRLEMPASEITSPACARIAQRAIECRLDHRGDRFVARLDNKEQVAAIVTYQQGGAVDFVCAQFRAIDGAMTRAVGRPTRAEDACSCVHAGCTNGDRARREWVVGESTIAVIAWRNPERMLAPDGTPIGELSVVIAPAH